MPRSKASKSLFTSFKTKSGNDVVACQITESNINDVYKYLSSNILDATVKFDEDLITITIEMSENGMPSYFSVANLDDYLIYNEKSALSAMKYIFYTKELFESSCSPVYV
jgi:hypothetical protein